MNFDPNKFAVERKFGRDRFYIRPAKVTDRKLVQEGYKNAPKEFFYYIIEITSEMINSWYPESGGINYNRMLPFNAMRIKGGNEVEFAGNVTLGFSSINRNKHTAGMGMGVLPKFQGRGVGDFLMGLAIKVGESKTGIARLELHVCAGNIRARNLYSKYGFIEEGILKNRWIYPDGKLDDEIIMSKLFPEKLKNLK